MDELALGRLRYRVAIPDPRTHLVEVALDLPPAGPSGEHRVTMPAWTPGSYLIREYGRQIQWLRAEEEGGAALPCAKIAKATWSVRAGAGRPAVVRYAVYAHELTVRTSYVSADFALLNGASIFVYPEGVPAGPCDLDVAVPSGWKVHCALPRTREGRLRARDYDELVDSPLMAGADLAAEPIDLQNGPAGGVEIVWQGWDACDAPPPRAQVRADLAKIFPEAAAVFGQGYPFERYVFFANFADGYGGLEHRASSVLLYARNGLRPREKYEKFLGLCSHELFHAWNVKRLRPAALGPFDYGREAYTRALWFVEGLTSYYDELLLRRAGLISPDAYFKYISAQVKKLEETPGRAFQSLEEASFDAWIRLYRPDENTPNSTISYYLKGELVGLLLDLEIRGRTNGARSLDHVMRRLWMQHGRDGARGFEDDAPFAALLEVGGREVADLADRWIRGRGELDFAPSLARAGLALERTQSDEATLPAARGWLGVITGADGGTRRPVVRTVLRGSPAERGGLEPGDEIVAADGVKVDETGLAERCRVRAPGTQLRLTVFRLDVLREVPVTLGEAPPDTYRIVRKREPLPAERALYESWLGVRWDEPPPGAPPAPPAAS